MVKNYKGLKSIIVEIGSWKGCSTAWLGVAGKRFGFQELIAIDLFTGTPSWGLEDKNTLPVFLERVKINQLQNFVRPIIGDSKDVIKQLVLPKGISILHIDGDHSYEGAKADFDNYSPLLNIGGIVIVDDYDAMHPDVVQVTDKYLNDGIFIKIDQVKEIKGKGYGSIALMKMK